jgi:putative ubiquitin-RnfH superfamily antitoxin RatB of RatAB toxin-antitoxin module
MVKVELIYAPTKGSLIHLHLSLKPGATVADVLQASALLNTNPEIRELSLGIFSKPVTLHHLVKSGDRIEIYRPLLLDPKERRRQRAGKKFLYIPN